MKIDFRTDSSQLIGTGHLMRCLTLADRFREAGHDCRFVCRDLPGNVNTLVSDRGYELLPLNAVDHPADDRSYRSWLAVSSQQDAAETERVLAEAGVSPDWLVVDHYGIDRTWETALYGTASRILVIDDLADREHDCDVITEQNYRSDSATRYEKLVPSRCLPLVGPQYALLRPVFAERHESVPVRSEPHRLLVFYGGVDATNETGKALQALSLVNHDFEAIEVVVGTANRNKSQVEKIAGSLPNTTCHCPAEDIAALMAESDLALGAGGVTSWERCALGLPTILTAVADNQIEIARAVAQQGAGRYAGTSDEVTPEQLAFLIEEVLLHRADLAAVSENASALCDGRGAERVFEAVISVSQRQVVPR